MIPTTTAQFSHRPPHKFVENGTYMVTAATLYKRHLFDSPEKLTLLTGILIEQCEKEGWDLQAWAVFNNHYHFIASHNSNPRSLTNVIRKFHAKSAVMLNKLDGALGREVWHQYWDTLLTYTTSYYARYHYVIENPVRHGLVEDARRYKWCSAAMFYGNVDNEFRKTVLSFKIDKVKVIDDF